MNKQLILVIIAAITSVLIHLGVFFVSFNLEEPPEPKKPVPVFEMVDAVLVEEEIASVPPSSPPEPEPEVLEEVSEAVISDEEVEEEPESPELPEPESISESEQSPDIISSVQNQQEVFIPFYKVEKRPAFIVQAKLEYPLQAERNRIEGSVIIEADIDENGVLRKIKIVKGAGFGFDEAASDMLRASTFSPAIMDGRPVGVRMRFTIKFQI